MQPVQTTADETGDRLARRTIEPDDAAENEALPSRSARRQPRRRSRGRSLALLLALFLVAIPGMGYAALKGWLPAPVVNALAGLLISRQPGALPWTAGQPANVLVMGLQVGGVSTNPLTDSMMVASYQPDGSVSLLSIPRDLWVEMPGYGQGRINEAFQNGGPGEALLTVQQNLGVPVNYYAVISYRAFERLVDDVGGVTVEVPYAINDPTFPAPDEIHYEPFKISKGTHHLNGHEALRYARTRHADSDFGRAQRQQQVLLAIKDQMLKPANWLKAPLILRDVRAMIRTNFPLDQAAGLAVKILNTPKEQVRSQVLQYENRAVQGFTTAGGADVLAPNKPVVSKIVGELFGPSLEMLQSGARVRVDNGNGYSGAATQFSRLLGTMGIKADPPGDADRADYKSSRVVAYTSDSKKLQTARLIAGMLSTSVEQRSGKSTAEIVVVLGRDYAPFAEFSEADWEKAITPQ